VAKKPKSEIDKVYGSLTNAIRRLWMFSKSRKQALDRAKIFESYKLKSGKNSKRCVGYSCERCGVVVTTSKEIQVHHIKPVGNIFNIPLAEVIKMMWCPSEDLLCVCKKCHKEIHKELKEQY
jgi:hypothetical protein